MTTTKSNDNQFNNKRTLYSQLLRNTGEESIEMTNKSSKVPKIIHQIVGAKTTSLIKRCTKSWEELKLQGFEITVWNDNLIAEFIKKHHPFAYNAFINARNHAEAADIARYLIIYTYGGYYVDWDIELLDIAGFVEISNRYQSGYMLVDPVNGTLASEYFCSVKNDPFLLNLTKDIIQLFITGRRSFMQTPQYSGPYRMRDSLEAHPDTGMEMVTVKEVFAYDFAEIRNPPIGNVTQPLIHYWVHSWMQ